MGRCCGDMDRRTFLGVTGGLAAGIGLSAGAADGGSAPRWAADDWDPERPFAMRSKPLRVQPILMYRVAQKREAWSWKSWGGVQSDRTAAEESARISAELAKLEANARFPLEILPVATARTVEEARAARGSEHDAVVVYPASGGGDVLRACMAEGGRTLIFARHLSGPVYYWYEALSVRYLRPAAAPPEPGADPGVSVDDVVIDDLQELADRLRALLAVENTRGTRIVALGGAGGKYDPEAPKVARERYGLEIIEVGYDELAKRIEAARTDAGAMARARSWTDRYLALPGTSLETDRDFVVNAFLLLGIFKDLLREREAYAFTIQSCMGTILPMAKTTACLTLSLLNDEGYLAFCESDFVIIPAGILLHHIARRPVFLHNSTFPHRGIVTCAHCTCPRRMDGSSYAPARILTHYESEYGAAPKIAMPMGQRVTCIDPEYSRPRWVGIHARVVGNPFFDICRSQQDVQIDGDWRRLLKEARDSHWVMAYDDHGEHLEILRHAAPRLGIAWESIAGAGTA
ncbi:MAG: sugar isomerase [Planctomycetes bacterium]|nr:sugar isomerase [Planctomycetota bacterium]